MEISVDLGTVDVVRSPTSYIVVHFPDNRWLDIRERGDGKITLAMDGMRLSRLNDNYYIIEKDVYIPPRITEPRLPKN